MTFGIYYYLETFCNQGSETADRAHLVLGGVGGGGGVSDNLILFIKFDFLMKKTFLIQNTNCNIPLYYLTIPTFSWLFSGIKHPSSHFFNLFTRSFQISFLFRKNAKKYFERNRSFFALISQGSSESKESVVVGPHTHTSWARLWCYEEGHFALLYRYINLFGSGNSEESRELF